MKLDNFAFSQILSPDARIEEQELFEEACRNDLNTLGLILLEFILSAFSEEGQAPDVNQVGSMYGLCWGWSKHCLILVDMQASLMNALKVAGEADFLRVKDWCEKESVDFPGQRRFEDALAFLEEDQGEGWTFLEYLLSSEKDMSARIARKALFLAM